MRWGTKYALAYPDYEPWFAWYPVDVHGTTVWWEWIERSFVYGAGSYAPIYRLPAIAAGTRSAKTRSEAEGLRPKAARAATAEPAHRPTSSTVKRIQDR